jgi:hypothetical protein
VLQAVALTAVLVLRASFRFHAAVRGLIVTARRIDRARFEQQVQRCNPYRSFWPERWRIDQLLRVDFAPFGPECQRLQADCRRWRRRYLLGLTPLLLIVIVMTIVYPQR